MACKNPHEKDMGMACNAMQCNASHAIIVCIDRLVWSLRSIPIRIVPFVLAKTPRFLTLKSEKTGMMVCLGQMCW
eukprot:CAMPEP_0184654162 /NCGR_PEP_ID=MMETSP0308-20130426/11845_1 /TAXON_ID=38269 /ORGANISM="Gloeochaete witrockiana, Strain SAG 46.84" /LENGTH=74 /DNA_ID=CAMNT_0027090041 /DNA_START=608 /DNA_END=829 /DNA_ORIENTATION=+